MGKAQRRRDSIGGVGVRRDADCDADGGDDADADAGVVAGAMDDDAHPASRQVDPQMNTTALRNAYRL